MNQHQIKSLVQLIGLASLGYGTYEAWATVRAINTLGGIVGVSDLAARTAAMTGYGFKDLMLNSPFVWIGAALIIAPYLVGLGGGSSSSRASEAQVPPQQQGFTPCPHCSQPVLPGSSVCGACGKFI